MAPFNGLGMSLGNLARLSEAQTRSISAENPTGEKGKGARAEADPKGAARELRQGVEVPAVPFRLSRGRRRRWRTSRGRARCRACGSGGFVGRDYILRIYWDGQEQPSVECPLGDFFASALGAATGQSLARPSGTVNSLPVAVNPNRGLNCFWEMPFRTALPDDDGEPSPEAHCCFYQINYTLTEVPEDAAYFHAQFRRVNPLPYRQPYTILDGVKGRGHYVGTAMGVGRQQQRLVGRRRDQVLPRRGREYPTICGTGTEDYFGGSYDWEVDGQYVTYTTPFLGMHTVIRPDGLIPIAASACDVSLARDGPGAVRART